MSTIAVNEITKADGTGSLTVPAESGTVVTTASPSLGRRNLIINGAMQVAQRGNTTNTSTNGYYGPDRFRIAASRSELTWDVEQSSDAPDGFANSYKVTVNTPETTLSASDQFNIQYRMEGQDLQHLKKGTASAESLTLSFWVKCSMTGTWTISLLDTDTAGERVILKNFTVDSANTWEYKTFTFAGDTTGPLTNNNNDSLRIRIYLDAGTTYTSGTVTEDTWQAAVTANLVEQATGFMTTDAATFQITGVQLEVGSVATPFEHRSYGEEEMLCRRYFQLITRSATAGDVDDNKIFGAVYGTAGAFIQRPFVPPMRATPDLSYSVGGSNGYSEIFTSYVNLGLYDADDVTNRIYNARADAEL